MLIVLHKPDDVALGQRVEVTGQHDRVRGLAEVEHLSHRRTDLVVFHFFELGVPVQVGVGHHDSVLRLRLQLSRSLKYFDHYAAVALPVQAFVDVAIDETVEIDKFAVDELEDVPFEGN